MRVPATSAATLPALRWPQPQCRQACLAATSIPAACGNRPLTPQVCPLQAGNVRIRGQPASLTIPGTARMPMGCAASSRNPGCRPTKLSARSSGSDASPKWSHLWCASSEGMLRHNRFARQKTLFGDCSYEAQADRTLIGLDHDVMGPDVNFQSSSPFRPKTRLGRRQSRSSVL
jgi:hypothetical protein